MLGWATRYENVIASAFEAQSRYGDPAKLADADIFLSKDLWKIKAGLLSACSRLGGIFPTHTTQLNITMKQIADAKKPSDLQICIAELEKFLEVLLPRR